jgi:hypothetical protein
MKAILALALSAAALPAFATSPMLPRYTDLRFMQAVVNSEAADEVTNEMSARGYSRLVKVERTAIYRCPGCFDYELSFEGDSDVLATAKLSTKLQSLSAIVVTRK